MKAYFAVSSSQHLDILHEEKVENILISYMCKDLIRHLNEKDNQNENLIIDSGAYTAWTKGQFIDLEKYISFCQEINKNNTFKNLYFTNLDVIPGRFGYTPDEKEIEESSMEGWSNYEKMKESGLKIIHIFHQHENFKWLDKLMKDESEYIGISPANDLSGKRRLSWLKEVFYIIRDKKKTHGYGTTNVAILREIPFYSSDSSNWITITKYGMASYYNDLVRGSQVIRYKNFKGAVKLGVNVKALQDTKLLKEEMRKAVHNTLRMQEDVTRLWTKRGISWLN